MELPFGNSGEVFLFVFFSFIIRDVAVHVKPTVPNADRSLIKLISFLTSSDVNISDSYWFLARTVNAFVIEIFDKFRPRFLLQIFRTSVITHGFR